MTRTPLRSVIAEGVTRLEAAGVRTPRCDAELLAAHLLGVERPRLPLIPLVDADFASKFGAFIDRRAQRIPLQYITGVAAIGEIDVEVGPGVFIPRPETELLLGWALAKLERIGVHAPVVVDLCTGSGALALAIAAARPDADIHAVDRDECALEFAQRNAQARVNQGDTAVTLYCDDVTRTGLLTDLSGRVDLVVSNPPYIPEDAILEPEVAHEEPRAALFAGPDGLSVISPMIANIARLLKHGGAVGIEHDDSNGHGVSQLLAEAGFRRIVSHRDLAGKPRFVTADVLSVEFGSIPGSGAGSDA